MRGISRAAVAARLVVALVLASLCVALLPAAAFAAGEDIWFATAISMFDLEAGKEPTLVIAALAREGTQLPAQAAIAIPKGATVSWAGESLGGDPSADPPLEVTVDTGTEYDVLRFTLTQSLRVQIEMNVPPGWITQSESGTRIDMQWTAAGLVDRARMGINAPLNMHLEDVAPDSTVEVGSNYVLYSVETSPVAAGQTLVLAGTMLDGPAPELTAMMQQAEEDGRQEGTASPEVQPIQASEDPDDSESTDTTWIIAGILAALVAVLVAVIIARSRAAGAIGSGKPDEANDDAEAPGASSSDLDDASDADSDMLEDDQ